MIFILKIVNPFNYNINIVIYVFLLLCLYILIVCLCIFIVPAGTIRLPWLRFFGYPDWGFSATLTEVFRIPWLRFFRALSSVVRQMPGYNTPRRGTASTLPNIFVSFCVLFVCKCVLYSCHRVFVCKCVLYSCHRVFVCKCVLYSCHRVTTQLQFNKYIINKSNAVPHDCWQQQRTRLKWTTEGSL
jgi:hypothetical protein